MRTEHQWRTSSASGAQAQCVELDVDLARTWVRDSKAPERGTLTFAASQFSALLAGVKQDRLRPRW